MDTITDHDIEKAKGYETLGPAYFAANRCAEALMQNTEASPFHKVAAKCTDEIRTAVYEYVEDHIKADLEQNLGYYIRDMVERTVRALLTGEAWAMRQYPLSQNYDAHAIREAVAKHGGEPLLMARIADLEAEVKRLNDNLAFYRR